jgi:hypothetical protein
MKEKLSLLVAILLLGKLSCIAQSNPLPFIEVGKTYEVYMSSDSVMNAVKSPGKCVVLSHGKDAWYEIELIGSSQDIGGNRFMMKKRFWVNFNLVFGVKQIDQKQ